MVSGRDNPSDPRDDSSRDKLNDAVTELRRLTSEQLLQSMQRLCDVGSIGDDNGGSAGQATNVVTDYALIRGEARSHDARFVRTITAAYRAAFADAAKQVTNAHGRVAKVRFKTRLDYYPFRRIP